jgi:hypothetical protein
MCFDKVGLEGKPCKLSFVNRAMLWLLFSGVQACQDATDKAFLIALSIPLVVAAVAIAYILRPPPKASTTP